MKRIMMLIGVPILLVLIAVAADVTPKEPSTFLEAMDEKLSKPPDYPLRKGTLAADAFTAGARLGAACAWRGGNSNDVNHIINCFTSNRIDLVHKWFAEK